eukprot:CAMPEP_0173451102 /NCGR_PEP_ID=MMETSP1357-20121228/46110_1 /TAXON_ID=77926 /ORGANISM="Hemiselmis rufescens, Strain PCC563" /LENGTH=185 /DNA_ID=CAMNT_0014417841 /DNA_START=44 /DNA_END=599 /DNA_ORIENTATION=-
MKRSTSWNQLMTNQNVAWMDERGTWLFYLGMLLLTRYSVGVTMGVPNGAAWTVVLIGHSIVTGYLFHLKTGSLLTWEDDGGKYDRLTYWEQIDGGREYSHNKKFLTVVPLMLLFLVYEATETRMFAINFFFTLIITLPKLPVFGAKKKKHRRGQSGSYALLFKKDEDEEDEEVQAKCVEGGWEKW